MERLYQRCNFYLFFIYEFKYCEIKKESILCVVLKIYYVQNFFFKNKGKIKIFKIKGIYLDRDYFQQDYLKFKVGKIKIW